MSSELDIYRDWLGIQDTDRPLNHYQLLRLELFEDDTEKIRLHYYKLNATARKHSAEEYSDASRRLLNELAKAMLCLTDRKRKVEYDASLGRKGEPRPCRSIEDILIGRELIDSSQLYHARIYSRAVGVDIRDALVQQRLMSSELATLVYAESIGVPFIDLDDLGIDEELVPRVPALIARAHSCAPVRVDEGELLMASSTLILPEVAEKLRLATGMPVRTVLCVPWQIRCVVDNHFPREAAEAELAGGKPGAFRNNLGRTTWEDEIDVEVKADSGAAESQTGQSLSSRPTKPWWKFWG